MPNKYLGTLQSRARLAGDDVIAISEWVCCHHTKRDGCRKPDSHVPSRCFTWRLDFCDHQPFHHITSSYSCTLVLVYNDTCHRIRDYAGPFPDHGRAYRRAAQSVFHQFATEYCDSGPFLTQGHQYFATDSPSVYLTISSSFPLPSHFTPRGWPT